MGGGGAIRAAASSVRNARIRLGVSAEHPVSNAVRMSTRPVSDRVSSSDVSVAPHNEELDESVQRPCWETGDWEFAGGEEELLMDLGEPMPRVIFGGAPSLQEAKEATSDLKDALETGLLLQSLLVQTFGMLYYKMKHLWISFRNIRAVRISFFLFHADIFLVMFVFLLAGASVVDIKETAKDSHTDSDFLDQQTPKSFNKSSCSGNFLSKEFVFGNGLLDSVHDVKLTVVDTMNSLSYYFQNLFGGTRAEKTSSDGSARISLTDKALGASFVGLAVMVIVVVVLKRGYASSRGHLPMNLPNEQIPCPSVM